LKVSELLNKYSIFRISIVRQAYTRIRYYFFIYLRKLSKSEDVEGVGWLDYSQSAFQKWKPLTRRIDFLVNTLDFHLVNKDSKLLVIGPRFECELYGYLSLGVKRKNLEALDTFSYSPLIKCGNMHDMDQFPIETFDLIIIGWTIVYAKNPTQVFQELFRVSKKGAKIVITWDSPIRLSYNHFEDLVFENTEGLMYKISDLVLPEQIYSWAVTRPSYNENSQIITLVLRG